MVNGWGCAWGGGAQPAVPRVRSAARVPRPPRAGEKRNGETVDVAVMDATKFRSRGARIDSFDDLKLGMPVVVAAQEANGALAAVWIAVGGPPAYKPADS